MNTLKQNGFAVVLSVLLVSALSVAQSRPGLDQEDCRKYKQADAALNRLYRQILTDYKTDRAFVQKLRTAQRAWTAFRDAHVESLYPERNKLTAYGSANPMCRCIALEELTARRTEELRRWIDGTEEGDVCSGSVRTKGR